MTESTTQLNAQSEAPVLTLNETLEIVKSFLSDNGENPMSYKQFDVCIAAKTDTDATMVANIAIRAAGEYPEAEAMSNWNDFDYYNQVSNEIQSRTIFPECKPSEGCNSE